jgi:hypothetical protein
MATKTDPILYLIRWAGAILVTLILSATTLCSVQTYLPPSCESEVADLIRECRQSAKKKDELSCMDKGVELLKACRDLRAKD